MIYVLVLFLPSRGGDYMLYQFIIKVLMGNSGTIFSALVMGVFGYMGWLLWNINERLKDFKQGWNKHEDDLKSIKSKLDRIDYGVYKDMISKLDKSSREMDKLTLIVNDNSNELEKTRSNIIAEVKESADEVKDIIMILMNNRARSIKNKKLVEDEKLKKDGSNEKGNNNINITNTTNNNTTTNNTNNDRNDNDTT